MWNIRGFNGGKKRAEVLSLMIRKRFELVGLLKTKVRSRNQQKVMRMFERN